MSTENPRKQKQFMLDYVEIKNYATFIFCVTHITVYCTFSQVRDESILATRRLD
jgi:hypothetical protein